MSHNVIIRDLMHKNFGILLGLSASLSLALLGGCSIAGFGPEVDDISTQAVITTNNTNILQETIDPSDWEKVRLTMGSALTTQPAGQPLAWHNEITGTAGSIVTMDVKSDEKGRFCRTFSTTLNGIGGVSQYRGDACRKKTGDIELVNLAPFNAVVEVATPKGDNNIQ